MPSSTELVRQQEMLNTLGAIQSQQLWKSQASRQDQYLTEWRTPKMYVSLNEEVIEEHDPAFPPLVQELLGKIEVKGPDPSTVV